LIITYLRKGRWNRLLWTRPEREGGKKEGGTYAYIPSPPLYTLYSVYYYYKYWHHFHHSSLLLLLLQHLLRLLMSYIIKHPLPKIFLPGRISGTKYAERKTAQGRMP